jgi:methylmalonyl-CoA mutase N-terminal domain/subunit
MQILVEEMGLCDTVDPLAGSYYVEWLTNELERRIVAEMERVENEWGGIVRAVEDGLVQREVSHQAWKYEQGLQDGSIPKVGLNRYRMEEEERQVELHTYRPEQAEASIRRTAQVVSSRDSQQVSEALEAVRQAAINGHNTMPSMMRAVSSYATLGEITGVLKEVFGEFQEPVGF